MENFTEKELGQLKTMIIFHIGYISELVLKTKEDIENIENIDASVLFSIDSEKSKDLYLEQLKEIQEKNSKVLDEYKTIYSKISNLDKKSDKKT